MAVSLPSDLVADVMRNADPSRRDAAVARLQAIGDANSTFAAAVDKAAPARRVSSEEQRPAILAASGMSPRPGRARESNDASFRGFEQMVLRNLFETLLPDQESGAFGGGPSAGVWRSMAADQLAGKLAENGGIGIARMIAWSGPGPAPQRNAQWPYFSLLPLRGPGMEG